MHKTDMASILLLFADEQKLWPIHDDLSRVIDQQAGCLYPELSNEEMELVAAAGQRNWEDQYEGREKDQ